MPRNDVDIEIAVVHREHAEFLAGHRVSDRNRVKSLSSGHTRILTRPGRNNLRRHVPIQQNSPSFVSPELTDG
jgi:hypothetical protein